MTTRSLFQIIAVIFVFSCSTSTRESDPESSLTPEQQEVSDLEDQVITMHDEVMPQMATLMSLKDELESRNQELESSGEPGAKDQVIINSMVIENLEQAHESMMDWMRNFQVVDSEGDQTTNLQYLEEELEKINSVKEQVSNAISAAKEILGEQ